MAHAEARKGDSARKAKGKRELRKFLQSQGASKRDLRKLTSWKVVVRRSPDDKVALVFDVGGKVLRSKPEVARFLGLKGKPRARRATIESEGTEADADKDEEEDEDEEGGEARTEAVEAARERQMSRVMSRGLTPWQRSRVAEVGPVVGKRMSEYLERGFCIIKRVLQPRTIKKILHGEGQQEDDDEGEAEGGARVMRKRKGNQQWLGAMRTMHAHILKKGNTETVLSPLTTREHGRYDMPLPKEVCGLFEEALEESGIIELAHKLCKAGRFRTQDIMLSKPGSAEQRVHTDSSWDGKARQDPRTHYLTVLIPLTRQDHKTGGTRVWPRSHRCHDAGQRGPSVDMIEPLLRTGDALLFDGLLSHQGMANVSRDRDRYFYYAAFSSAHDPNTDVTGS